MDARIEKLSRHLALYMSKYDIDEATRRAVRAYYNNVEVPSLGYAPAELWLQRTNVTMHPIITTDDFI